MCDNENSDSAVSESHEEAAAAADAELATNNSDDSGVGVQKAEAASQEASSPPDSTESSEPQSSEQDDVSNPLSEEAKPGPVPAPRLRPTDKALCVQQQEADVAASDDQETAETAKPAEDSESLNPPGFLYKVHNYALRLVV